MIKEQSLSQDTKVAAKRWKDSSNCVATSTVSRQHSPSNDKPAEKSKALLYKKLEERNASISNAKHRWNFIKSKTLVGGAGEEEEGAQYQEDYDLDNHPGIRCTTEPKTLASPNPDILNDIKPEIKLGVVEDNSGNVIRDQSKGAIPKIIKRYHPTSLLKLNCLFEGFPVTNLFSSPVSM